MASFSTAALLTLSTSMSACLGEKSAHTEIIIPHDPEKVWEVLIDIESYQEWNPALSLVKGKLKLNEKVTYHFIEAEGKSADISSKVVAIEPNRYLNHKGGVWGVITFDQKYILEPHESGTHLTIHEDYTGVYVNFWDVTNTQKQYEKIAESLKNRVIELN